MRAPAQPRTATTPRAAILLAAWAALDTTTPIGFIETCYAEKFATPRQGALVPDGRAQLTLTDCGGLDPNQALEGLGEYSHVWLLWACHLNGHAATHAKVRPPRLRGARAGLFATRTPFRPNPVGLTLARLDGVRGATLELSGIDLVDGTPVVDVKPYLPAYDAPAAGDEVRAASWVQAEPLEVRFAPAAEAALADAEGVLRGGAGRRLLTDAGALRRALAQTLAADPRPLYRWKREAEAAETSVAEYELTLDGVRARCAFARESGGTGAAGRDVVTVVALRRAA